MKKLLATFLVAGLIIIVCPTDLFDITICAETVYVDTSEIDMSVQQKTTSIAAKFPLIVDVSSELSWTSMVLPASMYGKNCEYTVSGSIGSTVLTVSKSSGVELSEIDSTEWWGAVLSTNGIDNYEAYNARYKSDTEIEVYPALRSDVTNGVLANFMYDAGTTYAGMHLTERGYKAYAQYVYNANPKHAEKTSYIARWRADIDSASSTDIGPFIAYGGKRNVSVSSSNINPWVMNKLSQKSLNFGYVSGWGNKYAHSTKTGLKWENIDLKNKTGYMELYLGGYVDGFDYPNGYEINVDLYLDGVLAKHYEKESMVLERICWDFAGASTATLDIYFNNMGVINSSSVGFTLSRCTFWENSDTRNVPLIQKGATVTQNFDSWGVYQDSASAKEFSRLHNVASGETILYENHSKGSMTSDWCKENLDINVLQYKTDYALFDFAINDKNSQSVTSEIYIENMKYVFYKCIENNIQPILIMPTVHGVAYYGYGVYVFDLIDTHIHIYENIFDADCNTCGETREAHILADLDGDKDIDTSDLALMKLHLAGARTLDEVGNLAADIDENGAVDTSDLAPLKLHLAGARTIG